jgi:hypothetical protein
MTDSVSVSCPHCSDECCSNDDCLWQEVYDLKKNIVLEFDDTDVYTIITVGDFYLIAGGGPALAFFIPKSGNVIHLLEKKSLGDPWKIQETHVNSTLLIKKDPLWCASDDQIFVRLVKY